MWRQVSERQIAAHEENSKARATGDDTKGIKKGPKADNMLLSKKTCFALKRT